MSDLADAGRAGLEAEDVRNARFCTDEDCERNATAVLKALGVTWDGTWEYQYKYDSDSSAVRSNQVTGEEKQRRPKLKVEWRDAT